MLYRDNGKEDGDYYSILGYIGIMENKMETTERDAAIDRMSPRQVLAPRAWRQGLEGRVCP